MQKQFVESFLQSGGLISLDRQTVAVGWGRQDWLARPEEEERVFYFPDFFLKNEKPWLRFEHVEFVALNELLRLLKEKETPPLSWHAADREIFEWQCQASAASIRSGKLQKTVPYAFETSSDPFTQKHLQSSLASSLKKAVQQSIAVYGFWNGSEGILGVTPELLFRQTQECVEAVAVAGTLANGQESWDEKLKAEHGFVVNGIVESLSAFGYVVASQTEAKPFSTFAHLHTQLQLSATVAFDALVTALHPTAAVGAYPKQQGWLWLEEIASLLERKRYGAPVGFKNADDTGICWVGIRNIQWQEDAILLSAGCGWTAESECEQEWQELQMKFRGIKEMLRL